MVNKRKNTYIWVVICIATMLAITASAVIIIRKSEEVLRSAVDEREVLHDKTGRYQTMRILSHSYLGYDFYGAFLLPITSNRLEDALPIPSVQATRESGQWGGSQANGWFTWDSRWHVPKQLKVWYERTVEKESNQRSEGYDKYSERRSAPGRVWCETTVTIHTPPPADPGYLILHFYPDGHVEGEISALKNIEAEAPRYTAQNRGDLAQLVGKPCKKQIDNPYYGTKRPVQIN